MFEECWSVAEIAVSRVASRRDGWHPSLHPQAQDAALRSLDPDRLTADEALSALVALQSHRAHLDALEVDLLVRAAGATKVVRDVLVEAGSGDVHGEPARQSRRLHLVDEVVDEIACALRRPHGVVQSQVATARMLHGPLARTRADLAQGLITLAHATVIAGQASRLATAPLGAHPDADRVLAAACERLQDRVLSHARRETPSQARTRARRAVLAIDAVGEAARRERAKRGCDVTAYGIDDGLAIIEARLPVSQAAWVIATVDARAREAVSDGTTADADWLARHGLDADASIGQLRAAAFVDLLRVNLTPDAASTADAPGVRLRVEVQVVIDAATLAGAVGSAWIQVGSGAPSACDRDEVLRLIADPACHATIRRLVTDPATGALVDRGARSYAISSSLMAWITARDLTCRFPGCAQRAARCDVDHSLDHDDGGPTTVANTGALCRRHHNRKTHGGWTITDSRTDGSCTFTSPAGRIYRHEPVEVAPRGAPGSGPPPKHTHPDQHPPPF